LESFLSQPTSTSNSATKRTLSSSPLELSQKRPKSTIQLTSILNLISLLENDCHTNLYDIFHTHTFVGIVNDTYSCIQYKTKLYLINTINISKQLFYEIILRNFGSHSYIQLNPAPSISSLLRLSLESPNSGWQETDGNKDDIVKIIMILLMEKREMLKEYFSIAISDDGKFENDEKIFYLIFLFVLFVSYFIS
jgi:DNA mismatch repair protein MLH1